MAKKKATKKKTSGSKKKVLILVFAGTDHIPHGYKGLLLAKQYLEAGHKVDIIYDGAGVQWPALLTSGKKHKMPPVQQMQGFFDEIKKKLTIVCDGCAVAFGVQKQLKKAGIPLGGDYMGHVSYKKYIKEGYSIITF